MRHILFIALAILLFATSVSAECQYSRTVVDSEYYRMTPYSTTGSELEEVIVDLSLPNKHILLTNPNYLDLEFSIDFLLTSMDWTGHSCFHPSDSRWRTATYIVPAFNQLEIDADTLGPEPSCDNYATDYNNVVYKETEFVLVNLKKIQVTHEECLGKNDGETCSASNECGSKYCIEGTCSPNSTCYQNNCNCRQDEVQCGDNSRCVTKLSVEEGSKPICSFEECTTKYTSPATGVCTKTYTQLQEEYNKNKAAEAQAAQQAAAAKEQNDRNDRDKLIYTGLLILIIGIVGAYIIYDKKSKITAKEHEARMKELNKTHEDTMKRLEAESRNTRERIVNKEKEIKDMKQLIELSKIEAHMRKEDIEKAKRDKENLKRLNTEIIQLTRQNADIHTKQLEEKQKHIEEEERLEAEWTKPFFSPQLKQKVWRNPNMNYYLCFWNEGKNDFMNPDGTYKNDRLVHRYVWEKHHKRRIKPGHDIHHKDDNPYNNAIENLEEIEHNEHNRNHRNRFRN